MGKIISVLIVKFSLVCCLTESPVVIVGFFWVCCPIKTLIFIVTFYLVYGKIAQFL